MASTESPLVQLARERAGERGNLTLKEAALILGISPGTLRNRAVDEGEPLPFPTTKVLRRRLVPVAQFCAYLSQLDADADAQVERSAETITVPKRERVSKAKVTATSPSVGKQIRDELAARFERGVAAHKGRGGAS